MARPNRVGGTATLTKGRPLSCGGKLKSCGGKLKANGGKIKTKKKCC